MFILWIVTGVSLIASLGALILARRTAKRLEELSQLYWELRYQQGELRTFIQATGGMPKPQDAQTPVSRAPAEAFVPLSAVKR